MNLVLMVLEQANYRNNTCSSSSAGLMAAKRLGGGQRRILRTMLCKAYFCIDELKEDGSAYREVQSERSQWRCMSARTSVTESQATTDPMLTLFDVLHVCDGVVGSRSDINCLRVSIP